MSCQELYDSIFKLNQEKSKLSELIKEYVQNKEHSLEERWDLFITSGFGSEDRWILRLKSFDLSYIYDWHYTSRYETIEICNLIENIEEHLYENADSFPELEEVEDLNSDEVNQLIDKLVGEKLSEVKEEILEKFIKSFTYDW